MLRGARTRGQSRGARCGARFVVVPRSTQRLDCGFNQPRVGDQGRASPSSLGPRPSPGGKETMADARATSRWWPLALIACVLALATLAEGPKALSVARGVVRQPGFAELPAAAGWSLLRMTASYVLSLVFAWIVGYQSATNPRAARVMLPLLDVGQSVPVLGFDAAAIFMFVTLLGGGRWGIEMESFCLLITSQS